MSVDELNAIASCRRKRNVAGVVGLGGTVALFVMASADILHLNNSLFFAVGPALFFVFQLKYQSLVGLEGNKSSAVGSQVPRHDAMSHSRTVNHYTVTGAYFDPGPKR